MLSAKMCCQLNIWCQLNICWLQHSLSAKCMSLNTCCQTVKYMLPVKYTLSVEYMLSDVIPSVNFVFYTVVAVYDFSFKLLLVLRLATHKWPHKMPNAFACKRMTVLHDNVIRDNTPSGTIKLVRH